MYYFYQGLVQKIVPAGCMLLIPDALLYFITNSLIAPEFEHLPQLPASIGEKAPLREVLNLLSLCNLVLLANALDPRTYSVGVSVERKIVNRQFDGNNIPFNERRSIWHCRSVCLDMFRWFREHYVVRKCGEDVDLVSIYLVQQAQAILVYKHHAGRLEYSSTDDCDLSKLTKQIGAAVELDPTSYSVWLPVLAKFQEGCGDLQDPSGLWLETNLLLDSANEYEVVCRKPVEALGVVPHFEGSLTTLDRQYLEGRCWISNHDKRIIATLRKSM
jgi:hypothetical protein